MTRLAIPYGSIHCQTGTLAIGRVRCAGGACNDSPVRAWPKAVLWLPYLGAYRWHADRPVVANPNQFCFTPAFAEYRTSHFLDRADATLWLTLADEASEEAGLAAYQRIVVSHAGDAVRRRVALAALGTRMQAQTLELEELGLGIAIDCGRSTRRPPVHRPATRHLVERAKEFLSANANRSISLAEAGAAVGASPVYLTQLFSQAEGMPLYRYHARLRANAALWLLMQGMSSGDAAMALDYSSHSQFCDAFRKEFGASPSRLRRHGLGGSGRRAGPDH